MKVIPALGYLAFGIGSVTTLHQLSNHTNNYSSFTASSASKHKATDQVDVFNALGELGTG